MISSGSMTSRDACVAQDSRDPLGGFRDRFVLPEGMIYLDGNSLGPMPRAAADILRHTIEQEWGQDLIRSWNDAGWFDMPVRLGDRVGALIGAAPGQTVVCDTTSINLFKAIHAAIALAARSRRGDRRGWIVPDRPLHRRRRHEIRRPSDQPSVDRADGPSIEALLDRRVAVAVLSQVNYRTGALLDMAAITRAASRRRRAGGVGSLSFDRRGRNRVRSSMRSISRSDAPTNISTAARDPRPSLRSRTPIRPPRSIRYRAGGVMPRRLPSIATFGPIPASSDFSAEPSRSFPCAAWRWRSTPWRAQRSRP